MHKKFLTIAFSLLALIFLVNCGGSKKVTESTADYEVFEDPFQDLTDMKNNIINAGGVAAVGEGSSSRRDLAKKKAVTDARGNLAEIFNAKIQRMNKSFQEELGSNDDVEVNEAFSAVTKSLTSQVLQGALVKKVKYMRDKETNEITCAAVVAVEPNKVNMSIFDELEKKDKKLYERFRSSQAYEELKREMEEYEN